MNCNVLTLLGFILSSMEWGEKLYHVRIAILDISDCDLILQNYEKNVLFYFILFRFVFRWNGCDVTFSNVKSERFTSLLSGDIYCHGAWHGGFSLESR